MKQNKYDDERFFNKYSQMERSRKGLKGAGEWHTLAKMLPDFRGKRVLDLGCGFGWHCRYAAENGALSVLGLDLSEKMLERARRETSSPVISYCRRPIEDFDFPENAFDLVLSSLAFHYIASFDDICRKVSRTLTVGGDFVFSAEHPVFTAQGSQEWLRDVSGTPICWPVDHYFEEGVRTANFLGEEVTKYHRTLTTYISGLIRNGFELTGFAEPKPDSQLLETVPGMRDELRRPMMLILAARKK
ncbi:MAG: class I SAM-dependent methyltransferase [Alphaproteobacteria bacterium]|jgi:SAM-dependent methyltransferase